LPPYVDHHVKTSPHLARVHKRSGRQGSLFRAHDQDDELKRTEHYNEYVKPRGLGHYATGV